MGERGWKRRGGTGGKGPHPRKNPGYGPAGASILAVVCVLLGRVATE